MRVSSPVLAAATLLAACSSGDAPAPTDQATSSASAAASSNSASPNSASAASAAVAGQAEAGQASTYAYAQANDLYTFKYSFPAVAPELASILKREAESAEARLRADAGQARQDSKTQGFPYHAYEIQHEWQQVANIPRFQSLSAQIYSFSGGAHGNTGYDALVWDKQASKELKPIDFFASRSALDAVIQQPFCKKLDAARVKKRGGLLNPSDDMFNKCIDPLEQTLILGSSNGKTFDRLGIIVGPYAAGPYAEGSYDITLPVTQAVLGQVKPEYKDAFSLMR